MDSKITTFDESQFPRRELFRVRTYTKKSSPDEHIVQTFSTKEQAIDFCDKLAEIYSKFEELSTWIILIQHVVLASNSTTVIGGYYHGEKVH